jgi:hypothetical protein
MDIKPSQANIHSAGQEIPNLLRNRNVYYSTENSLPLVQKSFNSHYLSKQKQKILKHIVQNSGANK